MAYEKLGRAAVRFSIKYLRRRYRRQIRVGTAFTIAAVAIAAYLASRNVPEG